MSNTQKKNVPELRFPGFEGEWEEKKLGEIFQIISGSTPLKSNKKFYENGNINWVKTTDLNNSKVTHSKEKITEYAMNSLKLKLVPKNSVLIAMYGGFNQIGRTGLLKIDATINQAISALLMNHETNPEFIQAYLNYQVKGWKRYAASSRKDPNITKKDIEQFKVPYVSINEQQKIGEFFSKLDRQIELEEQKLELLQQQKKGYMQKIFSQELRFKDENGEDYPEWEETKLQQIIEVKDGTHESPKPTDNGYLLVTSKNLKNNKLDLSESYSISKEDYESINKRSKVEKGDILFGMIGTIGNPILLEDEGFAIKNVALLKTSCLQEKYYILNFLKSIAIAKQFYKTNAGGTQKFISLGVIRDLKIDFPSLEESTKIGILFNKLDELIKNQSIKIVLLRRRKKALLKSMFI
ncbi:putative restriction and modification system specificity protein [Staphylococcus aureus]|nr:restriction endonuclease subunit S [Staphylococcus aureus]SCT93516.1 putative restriction and modification system specificity protein [Staphylococcus aureus]SCU04465.1 putative restriction and modification system specificity protein [Staphylococcus aureus]SCU13363.1 putative restriction and modification system specificity protein [Staphylococcus aureus]SCU51062.1 putative restriction and modification system specificity protein [Staphylococcus aureus]SQE32816.1 putative restriction and modif